MAKYSDYKTTGIGWLPDIPNHWTMLKIGALFLQRSEKVSDRDYPPLSVTKNGIVPQLSNAAKTNDGDNRKLVRSGDFVINSRSDRKGSSGISELNGSVSLINIVLSPRSGINSRYIHYLLRSHYFCEEFYRNGRGIVSDLWTTRYSEMKNSYIPLPSNEEQDQIVRYLDWQVSRINKIINAKKKQIELLEEQKKLVITETVTKGLDSNAEMKESGISWIGKCPKAWLVTTIGHCYSSILGKMLAPNQKNENEEIMPYFCAKDVHFDGCDITNLKKMWFTPEEMKLYQVQTGDLLVVEGGAGAGGSAIAKIPENEVILIQNSIHRVREKTGISTNRFLYYWLYSTVKRGYMEYCTNVATIPHYTKEKLKYTFIALPTYIEQLEIANYLDKQCGKIDKSISSFNKQIELLHEYRTRLISDVVTGQMDVRNVVIPEYEAVEEENNICELDSIEDYILLSEV